MQVVHTEQAEDDRKTGNIEQQIVCGRRLRVKGVDLAEVDLLPVFTSDRTCPVPEGTTGQKGEGNGLQFRSIATIAAKRSYSVGDGSWLTAV
jgi:hypothetical protein